MNPQETQYTLTAEEWEHYQSLKAQVLELLTESRERKVTLVNIQQQSAALHARYQREAREAANNYLELSRKHSDQMSAARRSAAGLVVALKALEALVKCIEVRDESGAAVPDGADSIPELKDAKEVIRAYGFPF